ncbi:MAG TPA: hypothetical protein VGM01_15380 [Ktedonobacteraceae bacterium]|jgi:hypothetical protein
MKSNNSPGLRRLSQPARCGLSVSSRSTCRRIAWWSVDGVAVCDECIRTMVRMNSDNEQFFRPALANMRARRHAACQKAVQARRRLL